MRERQAESDRKDAELAMKLDDLIERNNAMFRQPPDMPYAEVGSTVISVDPKTFSYWPCVFPGCDLKTELCVALHGGRVRGLCEEHRKQIEGLIERGIVKWA